MSMTHYEELAEMKYESLRKTRSRVGKQDEVDPVCDYCGESFCGTDEDHLRDCEEYKQEEGE